ncbi:MAG: rRNA maturation RNase YbeY [Bacteroidales bacterium]|jgi:rRNA maturation RNase YbeY|nr:rRNA maturation RNase YbeY [Bacteroidales bacterium]
MELQFFYEDTDFTLSHKPMLKQWIKETILLEKFLPGVINFIFTSDPYLLNINRQYLSHNYYTDIITFNYCLDTTLNGDIFISIDTVQNNSIRFDVSFEEELFRVMIHGVLHLMGYDDQTEEQKKQMRKKENDYLDRLKKLF